MRRYILMIVLMFVLFPKPCEAQFNPQLAAELQSMMDSVTMYTGLDGLGAAAIMPDGCTWTAVSGLAGPNDSVDFIHKWHMGSIPKIMTATIILQLDELGMLDINDSIGTYLGSDTIPYLDGSQSIKRFLNHTTNLTNTYYDNPPSPLWTAIWSNRDSVWNLWDVLGSAYAMDTSTNHPPVHKYLGLNNYLLLGYVIEEVTGNSLETEFQNRIFNPLGMNDSYLGIDGVDMSDLNGVYNGSSWRGNLPHDSYLSTRGAAGALISSPMDVATFLNALYNNQLLSNSSLDIMKVKMAGTPQIFPLPTCLGNVAVYYGLGTQLAEITSAGSSDTIRLFGHMGQGLGWEQAFHSIDSNLTLVLTTNDFNDNSVSTLFLFYSEMFCELITSLVANPCGVGIEEVPYHISKVYPNPGYDQIHIEFDYSGDVELLEVFNIQGALQIRIPNPISGININTNGLAPGIYLIKIKGANGQSITKWVKE